MFPQSVKISILILFAICWTAVKCQTGKKWAVLIAGSKGWANYRHQADLCHAYQLLRAEGIPESNIITMMYDDIANSPRNPRKGVLINKPNGPNVYEDVVKDYTGEDLNVKNFLNVLLGNKDAMKGIGSGRVLESGPDDTVFINIVDHGGPGTITINKEYLFADQLNKVLKQMKANNQFSKALMYVETCDSGSMFDSLMDDEGSVFAVTAAAPGEFSFIRYYDDQLNTYIGDAFSTIWMENIEKVRGDKSPNPTVFKQYKHVRSNVNQSHVMMYGDFRLGFDSVSEYLGDSPKTALIQNLFVQDLIETQESPLPESWVSGQVDVEMDLLRRELEKVTHWASRMQIKSSMQKLHEERSVVDSKMEAILNEILQSSELKESVSLGQSGLKEDHFNCYRKAVEQLAEHFEPGRYINAHLYKFANMCSMGIDLHRLPNILNQISRQQS